MASFTFTFTNQVQTRIVDAMATKYGWSATLPNGEPNPETKGQHAVRQVREYIRGVVSEVESQADADSARIAKEQAVLSEVIIT